jgi:hypothetical protein
MRKEKQNKLGEHAWERVRCGEERGGKRKGEEKEGEELRERKEGEERGGEGKVVRKEKKR